MDWVQRQFDRIKREAAEQDRKGGPGSGHYGHAGRPGRVGGSVPGGGMVAMGQMMAESVNLVEMHLRMD